MATVNGTVLSAFGFTTATGPGEPLTISAAEQQVKCCFVTVEWTSGTYAALDDADFQPKAVIEAAQRNARAVTILQACFVQAGVEGTAGTAASVGADACAVAANVVTCALTQEDMSTEHADGAMEAVWDRPITFCVTYHEEIEPVVTS